MNERQLRTLAEAIISARNGMGQGEFAKSVGIPKETLSRLESADREPTLHHAYNIARGLGWSIDHMLALAGVMPSGGESPDLPAPETDPAAQLTAKSAELATLAREVADLAKIVAGPVHQERASASDQAMATGARLVRPGRAPASTDRPPTERAERLKASKRAHQHVPSGQDKATDPGTRDESA